MEQEKREQAAMVSVQACNVRALKDVTGIKGKGRHKMMEKEGVNCSPCNLL